jgi:hypothetical protein
VSGRLNINNAESLLSPKVRAFADFLHEPIPGDPDWDKITQQ